MRGRQRILALEQYAGNLLDDCVVQLRRRHQQVLHTNRPGVGVRTAIGACRNDRERVQLVTVLLLQHRQQLVVTDKHHRRTGRGRKVLHRRRGNAAAPEERVHLAVLHGAHRLRDAQRVAGNVLAWIEAGGGQHAVGNEFGATAGRSHRDRAAFQVRDRADAETGAGNDVRVVRVQHGNRARGPDGAGLLERAGALHGLRERIRQREGEVDFAELQQLEVVGRRPRDFGRHLRVRNLLGDEPRQRATVRVVDAARAAGPDREKPGRGSARARGREHRTRREDRQNLTLHRINFLYLMRCGWSASAPRRRFLSAS